MRVHASILCCIKKIIEECKHAFLLINVTIHRNDGPLRCRKNPKKVAFPLDLN